MLRRFLLTVTAALGTVACGFSGAAPTSRGAPFDAGQARLVDAGHIETADGSADSESGSVPPVLPDAGSPAPLPSGTLTIDLTRTSVSGISSGAFMALQFGVAFSSLVRGIGVFAGGPFGCSQGSLAIAESQCAEGPAAPDVASLVASTMTLADAGKIDDPAILAKTRVFIFGGALDVVVSPNVVDATAAYLSAFVPSSSVEYQSRRPGTGHTIPTLAYGGSCASSLAPWVGDCGYDGAGAALAQIYGALTPASAAPAGSIATISQASYIADPAAHSLDDAAYVYIPEACKSGEPCGVHVAFHGCEMQASGSEGDMFYLHAGYNAWADTNHLVVLYPQTIVSTANPEACWDFWGYDSADYDTRGAPQMAMVRAMILGLAGQ